MSADELEVAVGDMLRDYVFNSESPNKHVRRIIDAVRAATLNEAEAAIEQAIRNHQTGRGNWLRGADVAVSAVVGLRGTT